MEKSIELSNGVSLFYQDTGGKGQPLVCIHGIWSSSKFFHKQLEGLGKDYRVIAVDLRGHGRSSMTMSGQTVPNYAKDMKLFIEALEIENYIGIGWSMGNFVWWDFYKQWGAHSMQGLVVIDQAPSDYRFEDFSCGLISQEMLCDWMFRVQTDKEAFMQEVLPMMFNLQPSMEDAKWMYEEMILTPAVIAAASFFDQATRDYRKVLKDFPIPMLVCCGELSLQSKEGSNLIIELAKDARLVEFSDCGHALHIEDSSKFNLEVRNFIREYS